MKRGMIRLIQWEKPATGTPDMGSASLAEPTFSAALTIPGSPQIEPPASAVDEAKLLLRVAAEVEGALLVQYLYAAYSLLPGVVVNSPDINHPLMSDDWYDTVRDIARQEMGHLITVQNLLLSLNSPPHLDRENFPIESDLYPFAFCLQTLSEDTLAKDVAAEAPRNVPEEDQADYQKALLAANAAVGGNVSRVGQIYERLYFLFQDSDTPQPPWTTLVNPFPSWQRWHVDAAFSGFNQDRQAQPSEWRGADATAAPDTAVYVLPVTDKASARQAIFSVALQGEGPADDQTAGQTHFDKFLRLYREFVAYKKVAGAAAMVRNQALNPTTAAGAEGSITEPATLSWANLANARYQILLLDIALALSVGTPGFLPGTTAARRDFIAWAFGFEMLTSIKKIAEELRAMPLRAGSDPNSVLGGLPFEVPDSGLPVNVPEQIAEMRSLVARSQGIRKTIRDNYNPSPRQETLLTMLDNADRSISAKIGSAS